MADEVWKPIANFEGLYEVSNLGRVRSLDHVRRQRNRWREVDVHYKGRILTPRYAVGYYPMLSLSKGKVKAVRTVHSLVADAFLGARPDGMMVCHRDGTRTNCAEANLYYGSALQNSADAALHGATARGERQGSAKLTDEAVENIRLLAPSTTYAELASLYGVCRTAIGMAARGDSWQHVAMKPVKKAV